MQGSIDNYLTKYIYIYIYIYNWLKYIYNWLNGQKLHWLKQHQSQTRNFLGNKIIFRWNNVILLSLNTASWGLRVNFFCILFLMLANECCRIHFSHYGLKSQITFCSQKTLNFWVNTCPQGVTGNIRLPDVLKLTSKKTQPPKGMHL